MNKISNEKEDKPPKITKKLMVFLKLFSECNWKYLIFS